MTQTQTDVPATDDKLGIDPYVSALSGFIRTCATPMTLAIQGDWGSGKTTLMNLVRSKLSGEKMVFVEFNTWQYSQFNLGDRLVLALITHLMDELARDVEDNDAFDQLKHRLVRTLMGAGNGLLRSLASTVPGGEQVVGTIDGALEGAKRDPRPAEQLLRDELRGPTKVVETLKKELGDYVKAALKAKRSGEKERVVIFIDDLDRLSPIRAIEVLEALKVFLDVANCVYVLALDFEVVRQGVNEKFGSGMDDRKAMAFFDKIIQVPFHMPVSAYDVTAFMKELSSAGFQEEQVALATTSVGNNPRSIKRLINTFGLLKGITAGAGRGGDERRDIQLFAVLCMQSAYPAYYREFSTLIGPKLVTGDGTEADQAAHDFLMGQLRQLEDLDAETQAELLERLNLEALELGRFEQFLATFRSCFEQDGVTRAQDLREALRLAAVTSRGNESTATGGGTDIAFGRDTVVQTLRDRRVAEPLLTLYARLNEALDRTIGADRYEVGIGKQTEAKLYANPDRSSPQRRGTVAELKFGAAGLSIRLGHHASPRIEEWSNRLTEAGLLHSVIVADNHNFRISLTQFAKLDNAQLETLASVLTESHRETAERLGLTSGR